VKFRVRPVRALTGEAEVPGDKSVSHRAALLGALADGVSEVQGYLEAEDCLRTLAAVQALGVEVTRKGPGHYRIAGAGLRGLSEPSDVMDCGNSGTAARLLCGVLAGQPFWTVMTADASMRQRPMGRIAEPLRKMGATVVGRAEGTKLPLAIRGTATAKAIEYATPVASAQIKSAVLLAGLGADGPVTVIEPAPSRDHSERILRRFGARVTTTDERTVTLTPGPLRATTVVVPGDISSAAFLLVAGAVVGQARVTLHRVGTNPTRTGVLDVLDAMDARITHAGAADEGEPTASLTVTAGPLRATEIGGARLIPRLIDEIPILAVAAAVASGVTVVRDAAELRVKESDRIVLIARELGKMGARIEERPDGMTITGGHRLHGASVHSGGDHRVAMALAVAGLIADGETVIDGVQCVNTSFPSFTRTVNDLAGIAAITVEG
jgi:3-phosphoshikimate 1-carboxyvinyltransferase